MISLYIAAIVIGIFTLAFCRIAARPYPHIRGER